MNKEIKQSIKNIKTELKNINIITEKSTNQPEHQQPQHQQPQHQQPQSQNTPAGYLGPQINHSHSYWTNSLRNHYY